MLFCRVKDEKVPVKEKYYQSGQHHKRQTPQTCPWDRPGVMGAQPTDSPGNPPNDLRRDCGGGSALFECRLLYKLVFLQEAMTRSRQQQGSIFFFGGGPGQQSTVVLKSLLEHIRARLAQARWFISWPP